MDHNLVLSVKDTTNTDWSEAEIAHQYHGRRFASNGITTSIQSYIECHWFSDIPDGQISADLNFQLLTLLVILGDSLNLVWNESDNWKSVRFKESLPNSIIPSRTVGSELAYVYFNRSNGAVLRIVSINQYFTRYLICDPYGNIKAVILVKKYLPNFVSNL